MSGNSFVNPVLDITGCDVVNGGPSAILWQFGQEREIASYYGCQGKTTRIHFDQFGQKFGAGDTSGNLCLWRFDAHAHSNKPYYVIFCFFVMFNAMYTHQNIPIDAALPFQSDKRFHIYQFK